jgi:hypothetical protein
MVEVGSNYGNTHAGQLGQTQGTQQTTGASRAQGTRGAGTEPGEVTQQQSQQHVPQLDKPRIGPLEMVERCESIMRQLGAGKVVDMSQIMVQIEELQLALEQDQQSAQRAGLDGAQKAIDANSKEQGKKLEEAQKKMEAEKTWNTFKDIFTYAGLAIGVAAAVATGGALAIGMAALGVVVTTMQQTGAMDKIFDAAGASQGVRLGVTIGLSVLMIAGSATNVAMMAKGVGTSVITPLLPKVLTALKLASAADKLTAVSMGIKVGTQVAGGVAKGIEAVGQAGSSVAGLERDLATKQAKDLEIGSVKLRQQMREMIEAIKESIDRGNEGVEVTAQVIQSNNATMSKIIGARPGGGV